MSMNLWNINSPIKRIDFYFKIDQQKKHLLHLKFAKSTFKQNKFSNKFAISRSQTSSRFRVHNVLNPIKVESERINRQQQMLQKIQQPNSLKGKSFQQDNFQSTLSPNKFAKFRHRQIVIDNHKLLKKLQNARASPDLQNSRLTKKYYQIDLKYKVNLQKTRYRNPDFTKQAEKLIRGQKMKFQKIFPQKLEKLNNNQVKIKDNNLDWKLTTDLKKVR